MVVEMLTFEVAPEEQAEWLAVEESVWSRFLQGCDGFARKQMWRSADRPQLVHAVIWWESREQWKAITAVQVAAVDARMGSWFREARLLEFEVVRES
jgi:uncharacterized protein (TIGR03792 family)